MTATPQRMVFEVTNGEFGFADIDTDTKQTTS